MVEGDGQNIEALLRGEETAFRALFRALHPVMVALARTIVSRHDLAEEVAQETWIAVLRGLPGFGFRCRLETWILGILLKRAKSCAGRESRSFRFSLPDWAERPAERPTPQDDLLVKEATAWLSWAVAGLPERQRLTFTLREIRELEAEDVTTRLGVSPGCQRVQLHRARKRLRRLLDDPPAPRRG